MRLALSSLSLSALTCALCACLGTSTGNPTERPEEGGGSGVVGGGTGGIGGSGTGYPSDVAGGGVGNCKELSSTEVQPDERTALGFSAQRVLAFVEGTHVETLTWHPQENASFGPESGERQLTVTVARKNVPLRYVRYTLNTGSGG
ncbi:MAG TPA: hypothetical protein VFZ61_11200, partial [Polyangiales bacterium]